MRKIVIVHHSNQLGLGGTEKDMQLFCKYMDKDRFEVHALAKRFPVPPHRRVLDFLRASLGNKKAKARRLQHAYDDIRIPDFVKMLGEDHVHFYTLRSLPGIIKKISPHILHVHHNGYTLPPLDQPEAIKNIPVIFTINGFGFQGKSPYQERIAKILFPSIFIKEKVALWSKGDGRCGVLYCPIEKSYTDENLRSELGIAKDIFVLGRVGRNANDIHDGISLKAYKEIENEKTLFLVLAAPPVMKKEAQELGIRHIRYLEPNISEIFLSKFYNAIDVLAHARLDGETFGCAIAEAMIHGKPVVTHRSHLRNAQEELLGESSGFVVEQNDWRKYAECSKRLMENKDLRLRMGASAKKRAMENFEAGLITKKLEQLYFEELQKKGIS